MKKLFIILMVGGAILATSCAKHCTCTYYEDDKKVSVSKTLSSNKDYQNMLAKREKYCEGVAKKTLQPSIVVDGKLVDTEIKCENTL